MPGTDDDLIDVLLIVTTFIVSQCGQQAAFSTSNSLPSLLVSTSTHHNSPFPVSRPPQSVQTVSAGGGMRLEAVMENLQRQQAARLALEEKLRQEKDRELRCLVESRIQQQALAIRHYQAAVRAAAAVTSASNSNTTSATTTTSALPSSRPALIFAGTPLRKAEAEEPKHKSEGEDTDFEDEDMDDDDGVEEDEDDLEMSSNMQHPDSPSKGVPRIGQPQLPNTSSQSHTLSPNGQSGHHEWTYEEQFKQILVMVGGPEDSVHTHGNTQRIGIPICLPGHHAATAQAVQVMQAAALEQLREKLESGEPPEKKMALMAEEQQRLMQHALQHNFLAMAAQLPMNIKINSRDDRQETAMNLSAASISSINMSIEMNGVVYAGVLFARRAGAPSGSSTSLNNTNERSSPATAQIPPPSSSHGHTPPSSSP
ncbi:AT-rich interactive domain-containing protein 3A-like [Pseudophryne corroboree]|uniref:AT-rich interactive domain-containing protein 3A-like n=1 Tax=Pseudophryne corroboree TaxID=495146 RepID=UPI00308199CD